jgi:Na+-transporting NADH:ubiquinone oxidoreductase subunit B
MRRLRDGLDALGPLFRDGGRFARLGAVYQMVDEFLFTPGGSTRNPPHVRDALDLKRVMSLMLLALLPSLVVGLYNIGFQANLALTARGAHEIPGWRGWVLSGIGVDPGSLGSCLVHGLLWYLPAFVVALLAAGFWSVLFAAVRGHDLDEASAITAALLTLILPPTIPLWQVAVGASFAIVVGKELFGGLGKNFVNPALAGWAFLFFAYPAGASGDEVWVAVEGLGTAPPITLGMAGGVPAVIDAGFDWWDSFLGIVPGTMGAESTLASLLGAVGLVICGVASWRVMAGVFLGVVGTVLVFNVAGSAANPVSSVPWHWHLVLGNLAFCAVFMATDPVSGAHTQRGRWAFGVLVGALTVLIRVLNPAFPEGVMLAILLGNLAAPLLDHVEMRLNIRRRELRGSRT